jgi:hypothetical protein
MALRPRLTAILATGVLLGLFGLGGTLLVNGPGLVAPSHANLSQPTAQDHPVVAAVASHSAVAVHPAADTVAVTFSNGRLPAFSPLGFTLGINVTTINVTVNTETTNISVTMFAELVSSRTPAPPYTVAPFATWNVPVTVNGSSHFATVVDAATVLPYTASWVNPAHEWLTDGIYFFGANCTIITNATSGAAVYGSGITGVAGGNGSTMLINTGDAPWATLNSPASGTGAAPISPGNHTVVASFGGDWVTSASLNITDPFKNVVYSDVLTNEFPGNFTAVSSGTWLAVSPGVYNVTITLTTLYQKAPFVFTSSFSVTKGTGILETTYVNTTTYNNNTGASTQLFGGWSPQEASAVLLVVGTIIGMVVALVLGRMMWGGAPASTSPAQPWSSSKAANECSVCHQSFPSAEELTEHQKSAHGM